MKQRFKPARQRGARRAARPGAAVVEFAITLPILFVFFVFFWEFARAEMIRHTVTTASYEAARQAIVEGGTADDAKQTAQAFFSAVGIRDAKVTITPDKIKPETETVRVDISVPLDKNALVRPFFMKKVKINTTTTLRR